MTLELGLKRHVCDLPRPRMPRKRTAEGALTVVPCSCGLGEFVKGERLWSRAQCAHSVATDRLRHKARAPERTLISVVFVEPAGLRDQDFSCISWSQHINVHCSGPQLG